MNRTFAILILSLLYFPLKAQQTTLESSFEMYESNVVTDIATAANGHTVVLANASRTYGFECEMIFSMNPTGQATWSHFYSDTVNLTFSRTSLTRCHDDGFLMSGSVHAMINSNMVSGVYFEKMDAFGQFEWSRLYTTPRGERPTQVRQCADKGYIVSGYNSDYPNSTDTYYFLFKTDSAGVLLWNREFLMPIAKSYPYDIAEDENGDYYVCADFDDVASIFKFSHSGVFGWLKIYYLQSMQTVNLTSILKSNNPAAIVTTGFSLGPGGAGNVAFEIDTLGNINWVKEFSSSDYFYATQMTANAGRTEYALAGKVQSQQLALSPGFILRMDNSGNVLSGHQYSTAFGGELNAIDTIPGGGYALAGIHHHSNGLDQSSIFIVWTDSLGNADCSESKFGVIGTPLVDSVVSLSITTSSPFIPVEYQLPQVEKSIQDSLICHHVVLADEEVFGNSFSVYPNPCQDIVRIESDRYHGFAEVKIHSVLGTCLFEGKMKIPGELSMEDFPAGILILDIQGTVKKLLKY